MQNQIIEQFTATTAKSYEAVKSLGDINTNAFRKLTDLQLNFINMSIESSVEQAKSLSSNKNMKDIFNANSEFASNYSEKLMDFTQQAVEIFAESRDEASTLLEKTVAEKPAPAKKVAKSSGKSTAKKAA